MKRFSWHGCIAKTVLVSMLLSIFIPVTALAATGPGYIMFIDEPAIIIDGYNVTLSGTASADPFKGQDDQQFITIDWGDGAPTVMQVITLPTFTFTGPPNNGSFTGTWTASHTYSTSGDKTATAKVHHQNAAGAEGSDWASFSVDVTIPPAGNLTVNKVVDGGTAVVADFNLYVGGTSVMSGAVNSFSPATYQVTEDNLEGYAAAFSGDCDASGFVTIADGDNKTCTVTNTYSTPATTLTVVKVVNNDNGGTAAVADFPLFVDGTPVTSGTANELPADNYLVTETNLAGYASSFSGDCDVDGNVSLATGENKTCTITNDDIAPKLTVVKEVTNDNGGTAVAGDFPLFVGATPVTSGTANEFNAGDYQVSETNLSGYSASFSGDCDSSGAITLAPGDEKTCTITNDDIYIPPGAASLTVVKHVVNDDGGEADAGDFTINVTGAEEPALTGPVRTINLVAAVAAPSSSYSFPGDEAGTTVLLNPGDYGVDEDSYPGYAKTLGEGCSGTVEAGDSVTCTITNDDISPKLTVTKVVINEYEGTAEVSDFPLFVGDVQVSSGISNEFPAGDYAVSETGLEGYSASFSGDCDAQGLVSLMLGDDKTCTITNSDSAPQQTDKATIKVIKHVVNNNGGTLSAANFTMTVSGTNVSSGSFAGSETGTTVTLDAGSYAVDEVAAGGYSKALSAGCSGTVAAGQTVTCTVTNDDIATFNGSSGGGGGGGGGIHWPSGSSPSSTTPTVSEPEPEPEVTDEGEVLGETSCGIYLNEYLHVRKNNNPDEVYKLQLFLNENLGIGLTLNGNYDGDTVNAVNSFQLKYADDVLKPWGISAPTGYVYITTKRKINLLKCPDLNIDIPSPLVPDTNVTDNE